MTRVPSRAAVAAGGRGPSRGARALAVALGLVGLPLVLELGLRGLGFEHRPLEAPLVVWNARNDAAMRSGTDAHELHPATLWRPRAGAAVPGVDGERINALGLRGPLPPADAAERPAVALLGDSSTFGLQVPHGASYAGRLAEALGQRALVLPAGVIGYTLVQGRARYRELLRPLDPEVVVLAFGAVNEHFPSDVGGDVERIAIVSERARRAAHPLRRLFREARSVQALEALRDRVGGGREGAIEAWKAQKLAYDAEFARRGELDFAGERRVEPEEFAALLASFVDELRADGVVPIVIGMPRRPDFEGRMPVLGVYDRRLRQAVATLEVAFLDARALFRADPRGADRLLLDTVHPTADGHALLAEALLPLVTGALDELASGAAGRPLSATRERE